MTAFADLLDAALDGENTCVRCGAPIPVTRAAVDLIAGLHEAGKLDDVDPAGVRMLLLLGSVEAGCGVSSQIDDGTPRASCPACASHAELARGRIMAGGLRGGPDRARDRS